MLAGRQTHLRTGPIVHIKYKKGYYFQQVRSKIPCTHSVHHTTMVTMTRFEIPKSPSPQLKTVLDYLELVKVLNLDELEKLFTDDFVQSTFPSSLNVPPRTKQEDLEFLRGLSEQLEGRHIQVQYKHCYCSTPRRRRSFASLPSRPLRAKRCEDGLTGRPK
jgi:hypothetical protein